MQRVSIWPVTTRKEVAEGNTSFIKKVLKIYFTYKDCNLANLQTTYRQIYGQADQLVLIMSMHLSLCHLARRYPEYEFILDINL